MMALERILAVIPARSGSKGLPDKNICNFRGKPLMAWTIEAAISSGIAAFVVVSTDSQAYAQVAQEHGAQVPFLRPPEFATDQASTMEVVKHALSELEKQGQFFDTVICLQPTSPLRTAKHIRDAYSRFLSIDDPLKSMASVYKVPRKYSWLLRCNESGQLRFVDEELQVSSVYRRQDQSELLMPNGAIFIYKTSCLSKQYTDNTYPYVMSEKESLDIDTLEDLSINL